MADTKTYIPISQLDDVGTIDTNNDVLIISLKANNSDQQYVSKKTTVSNLIDNVEIVAASANKIGGIKLNNDESINQIGNKYYVKLDNNDTAYVSVPEADEDTIVVNNGKISVNDYLKELSEDADNNNIVKKNETNVKVESKEGKYISGFDQVGGKIANVQYKELSSLGISVVNTFDNASNNTVPSTFLTYSNITNINNRFEGLATVAKTGDYNSLRNKPSFDGSNYVKLTDNLIIQGVKTFKDCPQAVKTTGSNENELVNVGFLKTFTPNLKIVEERTLLWGSNTFGDNVAPNPANATANTNWMNSPFNGLNSTLSANNDYNWITENLYFKENNEKNISITGINLFYPWTNYDKIRVYAGYNDSITYPAYYDTNVEALVCLAKELSATYYNKNGKFYSDLNITKCATHIFDVRNSYIYINAPLSYENEQKYFIAATGTSENNYIHAIYGIKFELENTKK